MKKNLQKKIMVFMGNRNSRRELPPTLSSVRPKKVSFSAQMLLKEDLTSLRLIGLFSMTHPMIQRTIFIELEELPEVLQVKGEPFFSSLNTS